ncbi:SlyX family protein [Pseudodesulfovibrio sp.]|uniref:SlyX family protein n=1 Tax=Pseudodesulfovibrio sp. TaxID=2035812 RepID=UPI00260C06CE|nr:SlyX family protein [Pseudodesulfovibrio sp.]MDD3311308.1 SlyX family protein [Pseudodesulfovibrio sp.]
MNVEERVERLESLVTLQDRTIERLSDAIFEQQQQLQDMEKKLERMAGKVREMDELVGQNSGPDAPPPHYGR